MDRSTERIVDHDLVVRVDRMDTVRSRNDRLLDLPQELKPRKRVTFLSPNREAQRSWPRLSGNELIGNCKWIQFGSVVPLFGFAIWKFVLKLIYILHSASCVVYHHSPFIFHRDPLP